jgi:type IV secretory pathway TraG/TraD family ATPase VirD4
VQKKKRRKKEKKAKKERKRKMKEKPKCVLVLGGPGTGKTRYYVAPLLLDFSCSFVVFDAGGALAASFAPMLATAGYEVVLTDRKDKIKADRKKKQAFFISGQNPDAEILVERLYHEMLASSGVPVRFVLDDFGHLPAMPFLADMAAMGKEEDISTYIVIQHLAQFQTLYGSDAERIISACSSIVLYNRHMSDAERSVPDCFEITSSELRRVDPDYAGELNSIINV